MSFYRKQQKNKRKRSSSNYKVKRKKEIFRSIPKNFLKENTQPGQIIRSLGFCKFPISISEVPFTKQINWTRFNYAKLNHQNIVKRGTSFLYFLESKKIKFKKKKIISSLIIEYLEQGLTSEQIHPNSIFSWMTAIKTILLDNLNLDIERIEGWKRINNFMKRTEKFGPLVDTKLPFELELFFKVIEEHPEEGEDLVDKMLFLGQALHPTRETDMAKCTWDAGCYNHNREQQVISFFEQNTKTGKSYFTVACKLVYDLFVKYESMIGKKFKKGGYFRHFDEKLKIYPPCNRFRFTKKENDFKKSREKILYRYLQYCPASVFFEEITGKKLPSNLRCSSLSKDVGIGVYGAKSYRKFYKSHNKFNPIGEKNVNEGIWDSNQVAKDSYEKERAVTDKIRANSIMDYYTELHMINQESKKPKKKAKKVNYVQTPMMGMNCMPMNFMINPTMAMNPINPMITMNPMTMNSLIPLPLNNRFVPFTRSHPKVKKTKKKKKKRK